MGNARKTEYIPILFLIAVLVLETTALPATTYIQALRADDRLAEADALQNGLIFLWFIVFAIMGILTSTNYVRVYQRCVALSRFNLVLTDKKGPEYFEGIGITKHRLYKTAPVDITRFLEDRELIDTFNKFLRDKITKYPGLDLTIKDSEDKGTPLAKVKAYFQPKKKDQQAVVNQPDKQSENEEEKPTKIIAFQPENLNARTLNFHAYKLEYFLENKWESQLPAHVREWLKLRDPPIADSPAFLALQTWELEQLSKLYLKEKNETFDFLQVRYWIKDSFDYLYPEELASFKSKGFKDFGDLLETNLGRLEKDFNAHFKKPTKNSTNVFVKIIARVKATKDYVPLRAEILALRDKILNRDREWLAEFSESKFENFLDVRLSKVRSMYYQYVLEYVETDESIMFAVDRPTQDDEGTPDQEDQQAQEPQSDKDKAKRLMVPIRRFLMILPDYWGKCFHFRPKRILFDGYDIKHPSVAESEFVFHSLVVHNIALVFCNSCDYTRSTIQEDFHLDINKFNEIVQAGLVNLVDELDASLDKLRIKINNRDKRIKSFKDGEDDMFEQWGADLDKTRNPIYEFKAPKHYNTFMIFWSICLIILGLVIGFFIGLVFNVITPAPIGT